MRIPYNISELKRRIKQQILKYKFRKFHLILGESCIIREVKFGYKNKLSSNVSLYNVKMGDYTYVGKNSFIRDADIGKFCSIASTVKIGIGNHPTNKFSTHPIFYKYSAPIEEYKKTIIGNDVWIGENVFILGDIKIGNGAVIGAKALVTRDVPPYAIVGGVPAKIIRFRFEKEKIEYLQSLNIWSKNSDKIIKFISENKNTI